MDDGMNQWMDAMDGCNGWSGRNWMNQSISKNKSTKVKYIIKNICKVNQIL